MFLMFSVSFHSVQVCSPELKRLERMEFEWVWFLLPYAMKPQKLKRKKRKKKDAPIRGGRSEVLCEWFEPDKACYCVCLNEQSEFSLTPTIKYDCRCCVSVV